jgi:hypothetical protein
VRRRASPHFGLEGGSRFSGLSGWIEVHLGQVSSMLPRA